MHHVTYAHQTFRAAAAMKLIKLTIVAGLLLQALSTSLTLTESCPTVIQWCGGGDVRRQLVDCTVLHVTEHELGEPKRTSSWRGM